LFSFPESSNGYEIELELDELDELDDELELDELDELELELDDDELDELELSESSKSDANIPVHHVRCGIGCT
jgi:hypothetical protein